MNERFVLDGSFALIWCFEDEAAEAADRVLSALQDQSTIALIPQIWFHEVLNGLGKGVTRGRLEKGRAVLFWSQILQLPLQVVEVAIDETLLEMALDYNLSTYDATYLSLPNRRESLSRLRMESSEMRLRVRLSNS